MLKPVKKLLQYSTHIDNLNDFKFVLSTNDDQSSRRKWKQMFAFKTFVLLSHTDAYCAARSVNHSEVKKKNPMYQDNTSSGVWSKYGLHF